MRWHHFFILFMLFSVCVYGQSHKLIGQYQIESINDSIDLATNHYDLYDVRLFPAFELYGAWKTDKVKCLSHTSLIESADFFLKLDSVMLVLTDSVRNYSLPSPRNRITSNFGMRHYRFHYGTDIDLVTGDTVRSVFDGAVRYAGREGGYGNIVVVRHYNGLETVYAHLSAIVVDTNQFVKAGELIGFGGNTGRSTGSHLHFETRYLGAAFDSEAVFDYDEYDIKGDTLWLTAADFSYLGPVRNLKYARFHYVQKGDYLGKIARMYNTSIRRLCSINGISRSTVLQIGRKLRVR